MFSFFTELLRPPTSRLTRESIVIIIHMSVFNFQMCFQILYVYICAWVPFVLGKNIHTVLGIFSYLHKWEKNKNKIPKTSICIGHKHIMHKDIYIYIYIYINKSSCLLPTYTYIYIYIYIYIYYIYIYIYILYIRTYRSIMWNISIVYQSRYFIYL